MKKYYILLFSVTLVAAFFIIQCKTSQYGALGEPAVPVKWEKLDVAVENARKDGKFLFLDVYTDWCGWCKKMDKSTYRDTALIRILNSQFHPVKLDAEQESIMAGGKKYLSNGQQFNELAVSVMNGQMAFPTTIILKPDMSGVYKQAGFIDGITMRAISSFFGQKLYEKNVDFNTYVKNYK
ncbi:MAG: DUF255 domain-containing protein [Bacteroidia bacterium]|nr:DUF255 domain-containing protein [Bacteroidia bacterium]